MVAHMNARWSAVTRAWAERLLAQIHANRSAATGSKPALRVVTTAIPMTRTGAARAVVWRTGTAVWGMHAAYRHATRGAATGTVQAMRSATMATPPPETGAPMHARWSVDSPAQVERRLLPTHAHRAVGTL